METQVTRSILMCSPEYRAVSQRHTVLSPFFLFFLWVNTIVAIHVQVLLRRLKEIQQAQECMATPDLGRYTHYS